MHELVFYNLLLVDIKQRIRQAQSKAILSANSEMISMYWDIGRMLVEKQKLEGYSQRITRDKGVFREKYRTNDRFLSGLHKLAGNFATGCCKITRSNFAFMYSLGSSHFID